MEAFMVHLRGSYIERTEFEIAQRYREWVDIFESASTPNEVDTRQPAS